MSRRVVITGRGLICALGSTPESFFARLHRFENAVCEMPEWGNYRGLNAHLAAPVQNFSLPPQYTRKNTRGTGRVALMALRASEIALEDAGLLNAPEICSGVTGVAYGSSAGSTSAALEFYSMLTEAGISNITSTSYIKAMAHTCAVNLSVFFKTTGRLVPTGTACTSGSLAVGNAYELIKDGRQDVMIAGGAEELCPTHAAVFDTLFAASTKNKTPEKTPRPYDKNRDGLVVGEGAGTLILEEYERAKKRGATIYAEVVGFGTNTDGAHVTQPSRGTMAQVMRLALDDANLSPAEIGYISGHGTATDRGDIEETQATRAVFNRAVPISSLKSYTGHTLGACGSLEAIATIEMMHNNWFHPTLNLEEIDPECADLTYIRNHGAEMTCEYAMSNNFAFGGINTSLIFKIA